MNRLPKHRRLAPTTLRAAWWAVRAVRQVKRELPSRGVSARALPPPPMAAGARTGVEGVLRRLDPNCIERGLVLQSWLHAQGVDRDVVVGVRASEGAVNAHAWVEGIRDADALLYTEIHRIPPVDPPSAPGSAETQLGD